MLHRADKTKLNRQCLQLAVKAPETDIHDSDGGVSNYFKLFNVKWEYEGRMNDSIWFSVCSNDR